MSTFTATVPLNIRWNGLTIQGATGATHRIPDAYYEEFLAEVVPGIPGGVTWIATDELGSVSSPFHSALQGVTTDQHHAKSHGHTGSDGSGTVAHGSLTGVGVNDHHNQVHSISGSDHTGTLTHAALGSVTADQHHAQSHNHSSASDGSTLSPAVLNIPGSIPITAATTFPGSPSTNQLCYRTDLGLLAFYDGARWLSTELFQIPLNSWAASGTYTITLTATQAIVHRGPTNFNRGSDLYLVDASFTAFVASGGTALGSSHKWEAVLSKQDSSGTGTSIVTAGISSGASGIWRQVSAAIGAVLGTTASFPTLTIDWNKTGTPGNLTVTSLPVINVRLVLT